MQRILVVKTGALGDVLRTTSILPGLSERAPDARVTWVTAPAAVPLVERHPGVHEVRAVDPKDASAVAALARDLAQHPWDWVLSFDDEVPLCQLASAMQTERLSGAFERPDGSLAYTEDVAPWFEMGLLSVHGKDEADRRKVANTLSHPAIFADMLGLSMGRPELPLPETALAFAAEFARGNGLAGKTPIIGLNTGAGGRWRTKELPVERVAELVALLTEEFAGDVRFLLLGGVAEAERNAAIVGAVAERAPQATLVDGGTNNPLPEFSALVSLCDLLVTSDSLALHIGVARGVGIVAFFAPTSAAEIELYGRGQKVVSTSPDYCSYARDADNSSITAERVAAAALRQLRSETESV